MVSPDEADAHERRLLQREDQQAERTTYLATRRNGDGTTEIRARVSDHLARRLLTYLEAFTSPRVTGDDRRPYEQRLGFAFEAFLEAADPARLPLHGGDATTVMVTVDLETLRTGLGTALVGDEPITAAQARRLACQAKIIPPSSTEPPSPSTWVAPTASSGPTSARRWPSPNPPAARWAARSRRSGAKHTTEGSPGRWAVAPTSRTESCSARSTTTAPTTIATSYDANLMAAAGSTAGADAIPFGRLGP